MDKAMESMLIEAPHKPQEISKFRRYLPQVTFFVVVVITTLFKCQCQKISGFSNNGKKYYTFEYWII